MKPGDLVSYITTISKGWKPIKVELVGIWDGEKVKFDDKEHTVVRTNHWLKKLEDDAMDRWKLEKKIEKIINENCTEYQWEGTEVDKPQLTRDLLELIEKTVEDEKGKKEDI